jgi:hypothetical protein
MPGSFVVVVFFYTIVVSWIWDGESRSWFWGTWTVLEEVEVAVQWVGLTGGRERSDGMG